MALLSRDRFSRQLEGFRSEFRKAFAVGPPSDELSPDDVARLERMAEAISKRGMTSPALMLLESLGPVNFLGSQALHFLTPILDVAFSAREVEEIARLLERRDAIPRLIACLEAKADAQSGTAR